MVQASSLLSHRRRTEEEEEVAVEQNRPSEATVLRSRELVPGRLTYVTAARAPRRRRGDGGAPDPPLGP